MSIEDAAREALRQNEVLILCNVLVVLQQAKDLDEAVARITALLDLYAEQG